MIVCEQGFAKAQAFLRCLERLPIRPRIEGKPRLSLLQFGPKGAVPKARG